MRWPTSREPEVGVAPPTGVLPFERLDATIQEDLMPIGVS